MNDKPKPVRIKILKEREAKKLGINARRDRIKARQARYNFSQFEPGRTNAPGKAEAVANFHKRHRNSQEKTAKAIIEGLEADKLVKPVYE